MYRLSKSTRKDKKWMITTNENKKKLHFGATGYEDFTIHKDEQRKEKYLIRHKKKEDWSKKGIQSAGFWARWLLWNKTTLDKSITFTEKKFNIKIIIDV